MSEDKHAGDLERYSEEIDALNAQLKTFKEKNEQLLAENKELTAAYNDLNEDFEAHKSEYGSLVTSNRDLTDRIGEISIETC